MLEPVRIGVTTNPFPSLGPPSRAKRLVAAFALTLFALVAALAAVELWWTRAQMLEQAQARASNLTFILAEYLREALTAGDASLRQIVAHGQRIGGYRAGEDDWAPILAAARAAVPGTGSISITDAAGTIRHSTLPTIVGESRAERYIFHRLAATDTSELVVDEPVISKSNPGRYIIPYGRRLSAPDGAFDGMVVATLIPDAHRSFFQTVDVGYSGIVWVFHTGGALLFRDPSSGDPTGERAAGNPVFEAGRSGATGLITGPLATHGPTFLSAYRSIPATSLIVAVSLDRNEVLQPWLHEAKVLAISLGAFGVTLIVAVLVFFRQFEATARFERELADLQRREAEHLRESNERLAEALEAEQAAGYVKDEFLMTVSHELRTPLNAIYGWARILGSGRLKEEQKARAIETIERNARAQTRLIDDLLDVSRVITGKLRLDVRRFRIADVVLEAIEAVRPAFDAKRIRLETVLDPEAGLIAADADRIQQVVWNLLSNAVKFTPEGGSVQLTLGRAEGHVEIVVSDTGIGISPEFLPHVFERFRQQEGGTRRAYGGLGLGLAIVRHLVELHGGTVSVASAGVNQGAAFRVVLPVTATVHPAAGSDDPFSVPRRPVRLDGIRVLVVDDDGEARDLFASILGNAGATVRLADTADIALTLLRDRPIDVLLADIEMPGKDGYQLAREALADTAGRGVQLNAIAVTAYARPEDRVRALEAGFQWYLTKPVEPAELVSIVASLAQPARVETRLH